MSKLFFLIFSAASFAFASVAYPASFYSYNTGNQALVRFDIQTQPTVQVNTTQLGTLALEPGELIADLTTTSSGLFATARSASNTWSLLQVNPQDASFIRAPITSASPIQNIEGLTDVNGELIIGFYTTAINDGASEIVGTLGTDGTVTVVKNYAQTTDFDALTSNGTDTIFSLDRDPGTLTSSLYSFTVPASQSAPGLPPPFVSGLPFRGFDMEFAEGSLWVLDSGAGQIQHVSQAGALLHSISLPSGTQFNGLSLIPEPSQLVLVAIGLVVGASQRNRQALLKVKSSR